MASSNEIICTAIALRLANIDISREEVDLVIHIHALVLKNKWRDIDMESVCKVRDRIRKNYITKTTNKKP